MAKYSSKGAALQLTIASVLTTITQVKEFTAPDSEVGTYDSTALDSGVGRDHDTTGYVEGGKVSFSAFFDPQATTHKACTALMATPAKKDWNIIWSDAGTTNWPFNGIQTKFTPKAAVDEGLMVDGEIQLNGITAYPS